MLARHRAITQIALAAGGPYGLALAGGYAVSEHGMGERPSGDVDLFTDWHRRADFPAAVDAVIEALTAHGYTVTAIARAEARDFLDVDAALASGRYTRDRLMELAANADGGFDPILFADAIGSLAQRTDAEFADYEVTASQRDP